MNIGTYVVVEADNAIPSIPIPVYAVPTPIAEPKQTLIEPRPCATEKKVMVFAGKLKKQNMFVSPEYWEQMTNLCADQPQYATVVIYGKNIKIIPLKKTKITLTVRQQILLIEAGML